MTGDIPEPLNFTDTLFLFRFHWFWMLVALGIGCWTGWHLAGEAEQHRHEAGEEEEQGAP